MPPADLRSGTSTQRRDAKTLSPSCASTMRAPTKEVANARAGRSSRWPDLQDPGVGDDAARACRAVLRTAAATPITRGGPMKIAHRERGARSFSRGARSDGAVTSQPMAWRAGSMSPTMRRPARMLERSASWSHRFTSKAVLSASAAIIAFRSCAVSWGEGRPRARRRAAEPVGSFVPFVPGDAHARREAASSFSAGKNARPAELRRCSASSLPRGKRSDTDCASIAGPHTSTPPNGAGAGANGWIELRSAAAAPANSRRQGCPTRSSPDLLVHAQVVRRRERTARAAQGRN